jgi:aryl-alcohol dehydrogenase-like predicted oxidoreductase
MRTSKLGNNGPVISAAGLGCMGMSDLYGSRSTRNDELSIKIINEALDKGISLLDTGDYYGMGHNELLIGKAIKNRKDKPVICVKFGALRTPNGAFTGVDTRPEHVKNFAAYSLTRLGVEAIDIYQPGRINPEIPIEDTVGAIADLIKEGKVKYLALSEAKPEFIRRANSVYPVSAVQVEYSLASRIIEKELLGVTRELGIGVIAYGVLSRGLLSGKLTGSYEPGDFRSFAPRFTGGNFEENMKQVSTLGEMARKIGCTAAQLAIAWVLHKGNDIVPLIGASKPDTLNENLGSLEIKLTDDDVKKLDETFPEGIFSGPRYPEALMPSVVN